MVETSLQFVVTVFSATQLWPFRPMPAFDRLPFLPSLTIFVFNILRIAQAS